VIDIKGITIAKVDDKVRLQSVETWFDPMEMFRQIAPSGIVNKTIHEPVTGKDLSSQLHGDEDDEHAPKHEFTENVVTASENTTEEVAAEKKSEVGPGNAVIGSVDSKETTATHEEMSKITPAQCPFLMSKE